MSLFCVILSGFFHCCYCRHCRNSKVSIFALSQQKLNLRDNMPKYSLGATVCHNPMKIRPKIKFWLEGLRYLLAAMHVKIRKSNSPLPFSYKDCFLVLFWNLSLSLFLSLFVIWVICLRYSMNHILSWWKFLGSDIHLYIRNP